VSNAPSVFSRDGTIEWPQQHAPFARCVTREMQLVAIRMRDGCLHAPSAAAHHYVGA
jgi:hypothetical protein